MAFPSETDRPAAETPNAQAPAAAPPLVPAAPEQSPWWSAPSGKPFGIPDFAHELRALFTGLIPVPIPVRVKARRR